jgi:hypothetical protein
MRKLTKKCFVSNVVPRHRFNGSLGFLSFAEAAESKGRMELGQS